MMDEMNVEHEHEEQVRIPLVVTAPGRAGGGRVDELVRSVDIVPTVLELAGLAPPDGLDGRSLVPLLDGGGATAVPASYADSVNTLTYVYQGMTEHKDEPLYAVTTAGWKYVHHPDSGAGELYDLEADPAERHNLFLDRPDKVAELRAELEARPFLPPAADDADAAMSPEDEERLRALGYVR